MADNLPINFPVPSEQTIASYNYVDVEEGTGIVEYYGTRKQGSAGDAYYLLRNPYRSAGYSKYSVGGNLNYLTTGSYTFDTLTFSAPRYVQGNAYFSAGSLIDAGDTPYIEVQLFHVDSGNNETAITGNIDGAHYGLTGDLAINLFVVLPITTPHQVKIGEKIRMKITTHTSSGTFYLGCDPSDTSFPTTLGIAAPENTYATTKMTIGIPFRLDL